MRRRRLSAEEQALWRQVTEKAEPLRTAALAPEMPNVAEKAPTRPRSATRIGQFEIGAARKQVLPPHDLKPSLSDALNQSPMQMDRKAFTRMRRGKLKPEARIDLHGMTLDRAHPALQRFILAAQASGKRLVLVITGKGRHREAEGPMPVPRGILRHQVPAWLGQPPLAQAVLQVSEAHVSHGGGGAYYVYLRRSR